ncbi:hypothetical protein IT157_01960 [bacterium]|nr:hypothetical protein [bacterium]
MTLPQKLVDRVSLSEGDFLTFELVTEPKMVEAGVVVLRPQHLSAKPASQVGEADSDVEATFPGVRSAIEALKKSV